MTKIAIIAADGARARLITAEVLEDTSLEGSPKMVEHGDVVNPLGDVKPRDEFSDRMSRKPAGGGTSGAGPATDDHRDRHELEEERRYARQVVEEGRRFIKEQRPTRLVLSAAPSLLGVFRGELERGQWNGMEVLELALDISNKSLSQIRELLTKRGLLPEPVLPRSGVYRPRGQEPSSR